MTIDDILPYTFLILAYPISSYACSLFIFGAIEDKLLKVWIDSNKTKCNGIVNTLKLMDPEHHYNGIFDAQQPLWYKLLEIFIGLLWPIFFIIAAVWFCIYYPLYVWPKAIYKYTIRPFLYWLIGKKIEEEEQHGSD